VNSTHLSVTYVTVRCSSAIKCDGKLWIPLYNTSQCEKWDQTSHYGSARAVHAGNRRLVRLRNSVDQKL